MQANPNDNMSAQLDEFCIITNNYKDPEHEVTEQVRQFLMQAGRTCHVANFRNVGGRFIYEVPQETKCCIVIGGDGTMLEAAGDVYGRDIPLLGINLGTIGYLAEIERSRIEEALQRLLSGAYEVEERMQLCGKIMSASGAGEEVESANALNDIVIARYGSITANSYRIKINGKFLKDYQADGIIVSTPTGSTGYNMSAGGPIVEPQARMLLITPICPHTLTNRSIVLSADRRVEIEQLPSSTGQEQISEVSFDGTEGRKITTGARILISGSLQMTKLIRLHEISFLEILQKKMA